MSDGPIADRNATAAANPPLRSYLTAAQRDRRVRADLDADWLLDVIVALVRADEPSGQWVSLGLRRLSQPSSDPTPRRRSSS